MKNIIREQNEKTVNSIQYLVYSEKQRLKNKKRDAEFIFLKKFDIL